MIKASLGSTFSIMCYLCDTPQHIGAISLWSYNDKDTTFAPREAPVKLPASKTSCHAHHTRHALFKIIIVQNWHGGYWVDTYLIVIKQEYY